MLLFAFGLLLATWTAWSSVCLLRNYRIARTLGLPVILSPVSSLNVPWIIAYKAVPQILPFLQSLPFNLGLWSKYLYIGWVFDDAGACHREFGPAFVLCTPSTNEVIIGDPDAAHSILSRRKDFPKPAIMYDQLNVFGRNVDSVEGPAWQRQRRLTAPSLNEGVSSTVWRESLRQARQMLQTWIGRGSGGSRAVSHDAATLALNVWTKAGFGIHYEFNSAAEKPDPPHRQSYRDALLAVLHGFTVLTIFPIHWLHWPIMPSSLRNLGRACEEFKLYMREMVDREKSAVSQRSADSNNLLATMVRASEEDRKDASDDNRTLGLSNEELFGNIFVFSLAGHETTANAISTALVYLAAKPQWQDWLSEEIFAIFGAQPRSDEWSYSESFPKLQRCFACLLETLRLAGSAPQIPKTTPSQSQPLRINGQDYVIPAGTFVVVNGQGLHCDRSIWGEDATEWRPDRWLQTSSDGKVELMQPVEGSFVPWADGPRVCPGKRFAQVEFVAVMSYLFRHHKVRPVVPDGSLEVAQSRALAMAQDCTIAGITLQMRDSTKVALAWSREGKDVTE